MTTRTRKKAVVSPEAAGQEPIITTVSSDKFVSQDDYRRSMAELAVDNVRTKADIIQLRDELKRQKENWATLCAMNIRIEQQNASIKDFKKKLLTTQVVLAIVALSAAIAAFI